MKKHTQVEDALRESGIKEGLVLVNSMHITSSVFINDDENGLLSDFEVWLEKLAPEKRSLIISRHTSAACTHYSHIILGFHITFFCCRLQKCM